VAAADDPEEVEVRGRRGPPKEPSVAGSVIGEERLRAPGLSAADVLRTQPGIAVFDTGGFGALSTASIRAAAPAQTPVYLAGVRLNDDVGGTADLSTVPLWLVHRIEIYRSNAPLASDRLGIGGAIFFEPRWPTGPEAAIGGMAGSFGARAGWADVAVGNDRASALVGLRLERADNDFSFVNDQGTRFDPSDDRVSKLSNNDAQALELWGLGNVALGANGRAHVVFNALDRDQGFVGPRLYPSTAARVGFHRQLGAISTDQTLDELGSRLVASTAVVASHTRYEDPLREAGLGSSSLDFDATRVENSIDLRIALSPTFFITPALRGAIERSTTQVADAAGSHARRDFARVASGAEWAIADAVVMRALASLECHHTVLAGHSAFSLPGDAAGLAGGEGPCNPLEPSGRIGFELGRGALVVLANLGRYARVPTLSELYGISVAVRGNATLQPETGVTAELGARWTSKRSASIGVASVDGFVFVRASRDLISYQRSSAGGVTPFNIGSARVAGLEVLADYRPISLLLMELSATGLDPRDTSEVRPVNDVLPYQSRLLLASRIELAIPLEAAWVRAVKTTVSYFYQASRYADRAGLIVIPAQGSLDVDAELADLLGHLSLRARVSNLLNETRFDLVGFPLPGRAAYLSMEARW
jgi:iron complex outermembrane receptor protein